MKHAQIKTLSLNIKVLDSELHRLFLEKNGFRPRKITKEEIRKYRNGDVCIAFSTNGTSFNKMLAPGFKGILDVSFEQQYLSKVEVPDSWSANVIFLIES